MTVATGPEGQDEAIIHLKGYVDPIPMGVIELAPRKIEVGDLVPDQDNPVFVVIRNTGDADLTVTRVVSQKFDTVYFAGQNTCNIFIPAGGDHKIGFNVRPTSPGRYLDTIMIHSDARNDIGKGYKGVLTGHVKEGEAK